MVEERSLGLICNTDNNLFLLSFWSGISLSTAGGQSGGAVNAVATPLVQVTTSLTPVSVRQFVSNKGF